MGTSAEPVRLALRKLWSDHVIWTRQYIVAAVAGTPDADAAAGRLLKNQEDIGAAIVPYYGQDAGDKLTGLLKEHILIAVDLVAAGRPTTRTHSPATTPGGRRTSARSHGSSPEPIPTGPRRTSSTCWPFTSS